MLQRTVVAAQPGGSGQEALSQAAEWMLSTTSTWRNSPCARFVRTSTRVLPAIAQAGLRAISGLPTHLCHRPGTGGEQRTRAWIWNRCGALLWLYQDARLLTTGELWALPSAPQRAHGPHANRRSNHRAPRRAGPRRPCLRRVLLTQRRRAGEVRRGKSKHAPRPDFSAPLHLRASALK